MGKKKAEKKKRPAKKKKGGQVSQDKIDQREGRGGE